MREYSSYIGILGMPRSNLDVMLNLRDRQRRQELLLSAGGLYIVTLLTLMGCSTFGFLSRGNFRVFLSPGSSIGQQCSFLFPADEESFEEVEPDPKTFPVLES